MQTLRLFYAVTLIGRPRDVARSAAPLQTYVGVSVIFEPPHQVCGYALTKVQAILLE